MRYLVLLVVFIAFCLVTLKTPKAQQQEKASKQSSEVESKSEGKNWKVALISVEKNHKPDTTVGEPDFSKDTQEYRMIRLTLRFEYIGPEGEIVAPTITLLDNKEQKYDMRRHLRSAPDGLPGGPATASWIIFPTMGIKEKRLTKTGEKFGPWVMLYFEIPKSITELKLVFGDAPPVPLNLK